MEAAADTDASSTRPAPCDNVEFSIETVAASPANTGTKTRNQAGKSSKLTGDVGKESAEKEDRKSQKATKGAGGRSNKSDNANTTTEVEVKKLKKEPKESSGDTSNRGSGASSGLTVNSTFPGYSASSYLQGLAGLPHPYASLFAAAADPATAAAANAFLTASHFGYPSSAPTDLSPGKDNGASNRNHSNEGALLNSLSQTDVGALRQLVTGYREAAALLSRTADELESFLCTRK